MRKSELEHLLRAAGAISGESMIVVIGSQAILASYPDPPAELIASLEADLYPLAHPALANLIDGSIGELSPFHETFGYYAHGVGPETACLPRGWQERLVHVNSVDTYGVTGLCLAPVDLAISKLVAGRPKDLSYVRTLLVHAMLEMDQIEELLSGMPQEELLRQRWIRIKSQLAE